MNFFNSLPLDLKLLVVGIAGCTLLALLSGNRRSEKRYLVILAVLAAAGTYRFTHVAPGEQAETDPQPQSTPRVVTRPPQHVPLVSTSAK